MKQTIRVTINGRLYEEDVEPRILLSHFLRENIGLTGTHVGCVVGECGACSVLLDGKVVKSCLHFAVQADGREVTTVEGLAKDGELSPIQQAFVKNYAFQCGYCTPGMVMTSHALLQNNPDPSEEEIRKASRAIFACAQATCRSSTRSKRRRRNKRPLGDESKPRSSKSEIRNKFKCSKSKGSKLARFEFRKFEFNFPFVSDFDIRISDLSLRR